MKIPLIIGVTGYTRAGKTTFANEYVHNYRCVGKKVDIYSFASAVRAEVNPSCKMTYGIDAYTKDPEEKEKIRPVLIKHAESRRNHDPQYWIKIMAEKIKDAKRHDIVVIDDVRHLNEAGWIWYMGGKIYRVYREGVLAHDKEEDATQYILRSKADKVINLGDYVK